MSEPPPKRSITVAGVTFTADQVKKATIEIDGRTIEINEKKDPPKQIGFTQP